MHWYHGFSVGMSLFCFFSELGMTIWWTKSPEGLSGNYAAGPILSISRLIRPAMQDKKSLFRQE